MKLLDAKPGQRVRMRGHENQHEFFWDERGRLNERTGVHIAAIHGMREWLEHDNWQPVETDAEKIARLEAELAEAKVHHCRCHCDSCGCPGCTEEPE